ncbi:MAG: hypothetical protein IJ615_06645 [Bacteroidaceae bacterium]|nr:hypothetical protein [Bacteroidaceae bacterium]
MFPVKPSPSRHYEMQGIAAKLRRNIKTAKQFEDFFADNSAYLGILIVSSPDIPCQTATQKGNQKEEQKKRRRQEQISFSSRRQLLRAVDKNFFSGSEIYFKGLEIYFRATKIYFQAFEKVLWQAAETFITAE